MAALFLLEGQTPQAAAESLQVTTVADQSANGAISLHVSWHWNPPAERRGWRAREELLAVSFDTRALVWVQEQASAGTGARGGTLRKLEQAAGPDGARRLFVIHEGQDGHATLEFLPKYPGAPPAAEPFKVYVAFDQSTADVWMTETALPDHNLMTAAKQDF